jgi:hypothetical protein
MNPVFTAWLVELGVIAVRDLTTEKRLPLPSELLASGVIFGALGGMAASPTFGNAAKATAWGLVLATLIASGNTKNANLGVLQTFGDFLGGKTTTLQPSNSAPTGGTAHG